MVGVVMPMEENWVEVWEGRNVGGVGRLLAIVLKEDGRKCEAAGRVKGGE